MNLFMASLTQFRHGMMGPTGLDYQGVRAAAECLGITMSPGLFGQIQSAERTYLTIYAERHAKP